MDDDTEIIEHVDAWQRTKLGNERRAVELRHQRWVAIGGFLKKFMIIATICGGVVFLLLLLVSRDRTKEEEAAAREREEEQAALREVNAREEAWVECVEKLGMRKCRLVEQHGIAECHVQTSTSLTADCVADRLDIRWGTLPLEQAEAEQEQAEAEQEQTQGNVPPSR